MLVKSLLTMAAMAGSALAGFDIKTGQTEWWYTNDAESTSILNAISSAYASYESAIETRADFKSAQGAFYTYARTRNGIPDIVTATGTAYTRYTTLPDWYEAMPTEALKVFESIRKEEDKIWSSVVPKAAQTSGSQGAAPQATGKSIYVNGAIVAVVGAVAAAL